MRECMTLIRFIFESSILALLNFLKFDILNFNNEPSPERKHHYPEK